MANSNPAWHNIFRKIVLKPDNITFEAETYKDTLNILRGPGVAWQGYSDLDTALATGNDTFMINVDYDLSIPIATTDLVLEDVNGNTSSITFTAGRGTEIVRNSAQELEWRSYSVTETDTLQTVTERNNVTNNKIFVNNIEVGTISSSFTEDGFPNYDAGHNLVGDGTLDNPLEFSPEYQDSLMANNTDQFEFTALGPGTLAYSASYVCDNGATTASVILEREDPSNPGSWTVLDVISGVTLGYSYAIQGIYAELYSGNVNYRLTYTWTGNLGVITWHVQNTFEGGAYTPIISPQFKTDTDAKTVDINDLQFFQNNIRTTVSNTDIILDPAGAGKVVALSNITAPTFSGDLTGNVTGNVTGDVSGNAGTVTNGVYTTGLYADPAWITSLDASKIIGSISLSDITLDGTIRIYDNVIETVVSNADLELRANGTGVVYIPDQLKITGDVEIKKSDAIINMGDYSLPTSETRINMSNSNVGTVAMISAGSGVNQYNGPTNFYLFNNFGGRHFDFKSYASSGGWGPTGFGIRLRIEGSNGDIQIFNTTASTSKSTGALQVSGGVGVAGDIYSSSINASNGALTSLVVDGTIRVTNNVIESIVSNANLELRANGTGIVNVTDSLIVTGTLTANSTVGLSPANAAITISPTGTGTVTINPATAGTMNNIAIGGTTAAAGTFTTLTATSTTKVQQIKEKVISGTAPAATETISFLSGAVYRYANNNANDWILNFRGDGSTTMNTFLSTDESTTVTLITKNSGTAYKNTSVRIDNTTVGVTVVWINGSAYPSGNINSTDIYTYTIIKTAASTYTVIASQTKYG